MNNDFDALCAHKESYFPEIIVSNDQSMSRKILLTILLAIRKLTIEKVYKQVYLLKKLCLGNILQVNLLLILVLHFQLKITEKSSNSKF